MAEHRPTRARRRGSAYLLVLFLAAMLAVISFGAVAAAHLRVRLSANAADQVDAEHLAMSAVEQALTVIGNAVATAEAADTDWRAGFTHGAHSTPTAMNGGTLEWVLYDATGDEDIADDPLDAIELVGIGRVGDAYRSFGVKLVPSGEGLEVLATALHTDGDLANEHLITVHGGPVSVAGMLDNNDEIDGDAEAGSIGSGGSITGTLTTPVPAKSMPAGGLFDTYLGRATAIPWSSFDAGGGKFDPGLLSAATNPYGATNADGVYWIHVPPFQQLKIEAGRYRCTLLISSSNGGKIKFQDPILLEPHRPDYPAVIVEGGPGRSLYFGWPPDMLDESGVGVNLNPEHTPWEGEFDADLADVYVPCIHGLVHVVDPDTNVFLGSPFITVEYVQFGTLLSGAPITVYEKGSTTLTVDPALIVNPPDGYSTGSGITPLPGSWRWVVGP